MIYTVTLNPSIDYVVYLDDAVRLGEINRMREGYTFPGGKGINVSRILNELEVANEALGFMGGFTGAFIEETLTKAGIRTAFTQVAGDTRINVKVKSNEETELNGGGPTVSNEKAAEFLNQLKKFTDKDTVILSGSKPKSLPDDYYNQIIEQLIKTETHFVIDTTGKELKDSLKHRPLVVKPNNHELEELFDVSINSIEELIPYGKKLVEEGARNAIISMAEKGAFLFTEESVYFGEAPKGQLKNSVGSGDSMIAGFVGTFEKTQDPVEAFKVGIASGSATAFKEDLATRENIEALYREIRITKWEEK